MRRFYSEVAVEEAGDGWRVMLDGRAIRTALGAPQIVPTRALAEALASEWSGQGDEIDPRTFPRRELTDYAIDIVRADRDVAIGKLLAFAETDTLCYRADPDEPLYRRQRDIWEPLVTALEAREGIRLERVSGVIHRPQPPASLAALRARLGALDDFRLAVLQTMASLGTSLCIALEALQDGADPETLWSAVNLEEDWQADLWGRDAEAEARWEKRREEFVEAYRFAKLLA